MARRQLEQLDSGQPARVAIEREHTGSLLGVAARDQSVHDPGLRGPGRRACKRLTRGTIVDDPGIGEQREQGGNRLGGWNFIMMQQGEIGLANYKVGYQQGTGTGARRVLEFLARAHRLCARLPGEEPHDDRGVEPGAHGDFFRSRPRATLFRMAPRSWLGCFRP